MIMNIKIINSVLLYIVVQEQAAVIAELNIKLKSVDKNLEDANKCEILYLTLMQLCYNLYCYSISHERETDLVIAV